MDSLRGHREYLEDAWRAAQAGPLSARKAMLVAMLIDAHVDRLFAAQAEPGDILAYRIELAAAKPALGLVMALCASRDGVRLVTEAVEVPLADYGRLGVEDFMVSLYNGHSVQRLRLVLPDGGRRDMLETLQVALDALPAAPGGPASAPFRP